MRRIDGDNFYSLIEPMCEQSENFGMDILLPLSESEKPFGSTRLKEEDVKLWFKNISTIALTLHKLCYKSKKHPLGSSGFTTANGGSIPEKNIPEVNKIILSKKDISAFSEIHHTIKQNNNRIINALTYFENQKEYAIPNALLDLFTLAAMEVPQKIKAVTRGEFYHFRNL